MADFDLNDHMAHLLMEEPFFAAVSRTLDKRVDTSIPTAGVRLNRDRARFERHYRRATTHEQDREGTRCFHGIGLVPSGAVARCARRRDAAARALFGADT